MLVVEPRRSPAVRRTSAGRVLAAAWESPPTGAQAPVDSPPRTSAPRTDARGGRSWATLVEVALRVDEDLAPGSRTHGPAREPAAARCRGPAGRPRLIRDDGAVVVLTEGQGRAAPVEVFADAEVPAALVDDPITPRAAPRSDRGGLADSSSRPAGGPHEADVLGRAAAGPPVTCGSCPLVGAATVDPSPGTGRPRGARARRGVRRDGAAHGRGITPTPASTRHRVRSSKRGTGDRLYVPSDCSTR